MADERSRTSLGEEVVPLPRCHDFGQGCRQVVEKAFVTRDCGPGAIGWGIVASSAEFQTKILRRSTDPDEYNLYRAALEWDLTDPIVIETRKDLKSENRWQNQLQPYHHQVTNLITFCRRLPVTLLADDVGLGKTISAGLVASELIARARVSQILIVCPKLLGPQWRDELKSKFDIRAEIATG
jgi:SNF2 family DNA or RNA helicase